MNWKDCSSKLCQGRRLLVWGRVTRSKAESSKDCSEAAGARVGLKRQLRLRGRMRLGVFWRAGGGGSRSGVCGEGEGGGADEGGGDGAEEGGAADDGVGVDERGGAEEGDVDDDGVGVDERDGVDEIGVADDGVGVDERGGAEDRGVGDDGLGVEERGGVDESSVGDDGVGVDGSAGAANRVPVDNKKSRLRIGRLSGSMTGVGG